MRLQTLGGLKLTGTDFQQRKALLLLTYLALEGPQERHHLAELFWPRAVRGRTDLSTTLSRLRKHAPGSIEADAVKVWTKVECDASALLTATETGDLVGAAEIHQDRFLEGVDSKGLGAELEEWLYGTREFLSGRIQLAQLSLAEAEAAKGQFKEAAKQAEAAYQLTQGNLEPDTFLRLHTLMLAGGNLHAEKLRMEAEGFDLPLSQRQEDARGRLSELLGLADDTAPNNLPARGTSLVGRELELAEVTQLLSQRRLVTLLGPGGVGKSRLALEAAQGQLREGLSPDGVFFVPLDALSSATFIPASIAGAISLPLDDQGQDRLQQAIQHLGRRSVLLVMDNFEHLIDGATLVSQLLQGCPNLKVLVTSRERLHIEDEWLLDVGGLTFPTDTSLTFEQSKRFDAVQLFVQRARQADPAFALNEQILAGVIEITKIVEGLPLALELLAVWVRVLSVSELAGELKRNLDVLASPRRDVEDRHKTIRASFEHSWELLTAAEQGVLRKLSVFRGGFRREAASEVASATLPVLARLVDRSLLRVSQEGRYDRHPLLYQFAQEKLAQHPEEQAETQARHGVYYSFFLEQRNPEEGGEKAAQLIVDFDEEQENIRAAWSWAVTERRVDELNRAIETHAHYYLAVSSSQEAIEAYDLVINILDETDPAHHAFLGMALTGKAWMKHQLGSNEEAIELAERSLKLLRPLGRTTARRLLIAQETMTFSLLDLGSYAEARRYSESTVALAKTLRNSRRMAIGLIGLGMADSALGSYHQAKQHFEEAVVLGQRHNFALAIVSGLLNLGGTNLLLGDLDEASSTLEEGLQLVVGKLGWRSFRPSFLIFLSRTAYARREYREARALGEEALTLVRERGYSGMEPQILNTLGRIANAQSDFVTAETYLMRSLNAARSLQVPPMILEGLVAFAELLSKQGQVEKACESLSLVVHHLGTKQRDKDEAQRLFDDLRDRAEPAELAAAVERGKDLTVDDLLNDLLPVI